MKKAFAFLALIIFAAVLTANDPPVVNQEISIPQLIQTVSPFENDALCSWRRTTQPFGLADTINTDGTDKYHTGVDVACRSGAKVAAPFTCKVIYTQTSSADSGWGTNIICQAKLVSGNKVCFRAAHMIPGSLRVSEGQLILAGQLIGLEGKSGFSVGAGGVHLHFQVLDCNEGYPFSDDDAYAGKDGHFNQLRLFYNPLRFLDELKNPREIRSSLNRVRFESSGAFSGHSWISTSPNFIDINNWESLSVNNWEQRFEKRSYRSGRAVYYKANYLLTKNNGHTVRVRPFLPHKGAYRVYFKVPNDNDVVGGKVKLRIHYKGYQDPPSMPLRVHEEILNFNAQSQGKFIPITGYINCLKGKNCLVEVISEGLNGKNYFAFEELKWVYVSDMYSNFPFGRGLINGNDVFYTPLPNSTELGFINLAYNRGTTAANLKLSAWHVKRAGRRVQLPCKTSSLAGVDESCVFLQGETGDILEIRVATEGGKSCHPHCGIILVAVNNYPELSFQGGFPPLEINSIFADVGAAGLWFTPWLFKASSVGLLTGVCNEDFKNENCFYRPSRNVKKAEFVKMVISAIGQRNPASCTANHYSDMSSGDWFCPYVQELKKKLPADFIWSGEAPTRFFPGQDLTRELAAFIAYKALGVSNSYNASRDEFIYCDVAVSAYREAIYSLHRLGIMTGFKPDISQGNCLYNFSPDKILNRAQAAKLAFKIFEYAYQKGVGN